MSTILFTSQTTPATPTPGKARLFIDSADNILKSVDSTGNITIYGALSVEDIQDLIGAFIANSATVTSVYDDLGNTIHFDVVQSALDHTLFQNIGTNSHATIDTHLASTSNPHSVTKTQIGLSNVPNVDATNPANISQDSTHRFVTDTEILDWNAKQIAITLANVGSSSNPTGATLSAGTLTLQAADSTNPGVLTTGAQTIAGAKTFSGSISASNLSGTNTGDVSLGTTNGLSISSQTLSLQSADATHTGALTSSDWTTFNNKQSAITQGNLTESTSSVLTVTGGTGSVIGSGTSIQVKQSSTTQDGYLSHTDWNTFNNKQSSGNYLTALTSDVSASGPGSATATVNSVGGSSAANVHSAELAANAATSVNTNSTIVKRDSSGNFSAGTITATLSGNASTATSATSFTGSLSGDVTGTQGSTSVATVGGSSAANIHSAELASNAATSSNTASTIVKRDASGNFTAGTITASLNGNASTATSATSFSGSLSGDVTGTQSSTSVASVGGSSAANVHSAELLANAATNANTSSTIVKRDSTGSFNSTNLGLSGKISFSTVGDQFVLSQDTSPFRRGTWSNTASGDLYTLVGDFVMEYESHNTPIDPTTGNFLGRDEAGTCQLYVFTENGDRKRYDAPSASAGVVPVFTLTSSDGASGFVGHVATAAQTGITSLGTQASDFNMGSHKIVNVANGTAATDAVNFGQLSNVAAGFLPQSPILEPNLTNDTLSTPPSSPVAGTCYLIGTSPTGAWASIGAGRVAQWDGSVWTDCLGRVAVIGDRFGINFENLATPAGNLTGHTNTIAVLTNATPGAYAYTFQTPSQRWLTTVSNDFSTSNGDSYFFDGTSWIEIASGITISAGIALTKVGATLNVNVDTSSVGINGSNQLQVTGVGGSTAANIHSAELLANAATSVNTPSTIVQRDSSGKFVASGIGIGMTPVRALDVTGSIGATGQLVSTVATGTAPLSVSSTTNVPNLNASSLNGATFAAPGAIGSTTPSTAAFTTASATTFTGALTGTASGNTTYTANNHGVVVSSATNAMTVIAPNASTALPLVSGGTGANPTWSALTVPGGGTGVTTLTGLAYGNGTGAMTAATAAQVVSAIGSTAVTNATNVTGTVAIANGGTGQTTQQAAINALTGTQSSGTYLRSNGTNASLSAIQAADVPTLNQNTTGNAATFTGSLTGDVTSTAMATTVASVGGSTAANVHSAELLANAATNVNTPSTIVKRDGSGNFTAGTITASLSGNASTATSATSFSGSLVGDVTGTQGATTVASVGGSSAANIHSAELVANAATSLNTASTIVKRDSSGNFTAGTITATLSGNASSATTATNFSGSLGGDVTGTQTTTSISDTTVTGKKLTGFTSGAGTVAATDSILQAINKLDGNIAGKQAAGSYVSQSTTVNGHALSSNVTVTASDVGLGSVNNTADSSKVIAGDVTGTLGASTVSKIQGNAVASGAPTDGYVLTWNGTATQWEPQNPASSFQINTTANVDTALTASSNYYQLYTGTTPGQRVSLPDATTLTASFADYYIVNKSTSIIPIHDFSGNLMTVIYPEQYAELILVSNATAAGVWFIETSNPNPLQQSALFDDFISAGTTSGTIGVLGWTLVSGAGHTMSYATSANSGPGVLVLGTGTGVLAGYAIHLGNTEYVVGGGSLILEWRVQFPTLATPGQDYNCYIGLNNTLTANAEPINAIYFAYNRATSSNWLIKTANGGTRTSTTTSTAVTAGAWYKLTMVVNAAGSNVDYYINNLFVGSISTNIPTGTLGPQHNTQKTAGGTDISNWVDYFYLLKNTSTVR